jgi:hypothetical protein
VFDFVINCAAETKLAQTEAVRDAKNFLPIIDCVW